MRITHVYESIDESNVREVSREENIALLERKKRSLLHELKMLSVTMNQMMTSGVVSQMGEASKHPSQPIIPDSETRCVLATDPHTQEKALKTFARFAMVREILSTSVMSELLVLQKEDKGNDSTVAKG